MALWTPWRRETAGRRSGFGARLPLQAPLPGLRTDTRFRQTSTALPDGGRESLKPARGVVNRTWDIEAASPYFSTACHRLMFRCGLRTWMVLLLRRPY